jgi:hypothetical protein
MKAEMLQTSQDLTPLRERSDVQCLLRALRAPWHEKHEFLRVLGRQLLKPAPPSLDQPIRPDEVNLNRFTRGARAGKRLNRHSVFKFLAEYVEDSENPSLGFRITRM